MQADRADGLKWLTRGKNKRCVDQEWDTRRLLLHFLRTRGKEKVTGVQSEGSLKKGKEKGTRKEKTPKEREKGKGSGFIKQGNPEKGKREGFAKK